MLTSCCHKCGRTHRGSQGTRSWGRARQCWREWGTRSRSLTAAGLATVSNFYLLLHLDVAALDVAAPGVGGVGAPESSMEKPSPVISPRELPGSPWSNTWTMNSAVPRVLRDTGRLVLRSVRAFELGRVREGLSRLLARGDARDEEGVHDAVEPDRRELVNSRPDRCWGRCRGK